MNSLQTIDPSNLVKKADYNTKIGETEKKILDHYHDKYVTTEVNERKFCCKIKTSKISH